ncbi:MAG: hypothetical protein AAF573_06060, partial [Bacteroidota bacterium]
MAQPDGQKIALRWSVLDIAAWKEGNAVGYTLERYTTHVNGAQLNYTDIQSSKLILGSNLKPLTKQQWNSQFTNNDFAKVAKRVIYKEDASTILSGDPTLADALNQQESEEARLLFGLFVAEQDFDVAKGMALGFEDTNIQSGCIYYYTLKLNSTNPDFSDIQSIIQVNSDDTPDLPTISEVSGEPMNKAILIQWNIEAVRAQYSSFDVERSTDGINFTKANDLPFIFGAEGEEDPTYAVYQDEIPDNTTIYHYRVRGRSPFGTQGPPSEVVSLSGRPDRINIFVQINEHESEETFTTLNWNNFDQAMETNIKGFNVFRSNFSNHSFEQINSGMIAPSSRSFTDTDPLKMGYYKLEAVDKNDYTYQSPAYLVQQPDSIPPAIPTGLVGKFITKKRVQLNWDANTEEDLQGYRLFVSNGLASNYTQITKAAVIGEQFIYDVDPTFMV